MDRQPGRPEPELGQRIGRLLVLEIAPAPLHVFAADSKRKRWFRCACDCGATVIVMAQGLRRGTTRSCGCLQLELRRSYSDAMAREKRAGDRS
jgi:hypothetical protein